MKKSFSALIALIAVTAFFTITVLSTNTASAHEAPTAGFGTLSPDAPPETAQFAFMIGEWTCKTRSMAPDRTIKDGPVASWTGYYILGGWAIQDDWVSPGPNGKPFPGTNIRSFNPQTRKWDNRWLAAGALQWSYFEAEQVGDTMVMTGGESVDAQKRKFMDRNIFHDIKDTSWKWRKDRSFDGGKNWIEGVSYINCTAK